MSEKKGETAGYLHNALHQALNTPWAFLSYIREMTKTHLQANLALRNAPDVSYILSHAKKDTLNQNTNFIISLAYPTAYAMLATLTDPITTSVITNITTKGQTKPQISLINILAHTRSILGRNY